MEHEKWRRNWDLNGYIAGILVTGLIFIISVILMLVAVSAEAYIVLWIFVPAVIVSGGWVYYYAIKISNMF